MYLVHVHTVPSVQTVLNLLHNADMKKHYTIQLQRVGQKCLDVIIPLNEVVTLQFTVDLARVLWQNELRPLALACSLRRN